MSDKTPQNTEKSRTRATSSRARPQGTRRKTAKTPKTAPADTQDNQISQGPQPAVFEELPIPAVIYDADNKLIAANRLCRLAFQSNPDIVTPGTPMEDIFKSSVEEDLFEDTSQMDSLIARISALKPGEVDHTPLEMRDGRTVGHSARKLDNGNWIGTISDIKELAKAEAQAREAENRWNFALESARQGVWDSDLITGDVFYSHMWRVLRGLEECDESELTAEAWQQRLHPEDKDFILDAMQRQNEGEYFENGFEYRERHSNGSWIWIQSRGHAVAWDCDGKPSRIIGTDTDITETRNAQAALAEAEARWDFALRGTGQGVWDTDIPNKTVFYSPTWREMRGFTLDEDIDSSPEAWLKRVHPDDRDRVREIIAKQDNGDIQYNLFEYRELHRDGHYIWIQSRGEPVSWDEAGHPTRMIGVDTDITVRKELELKLKESLQLFNTTLDNFPGGILMLDRKLVLTVANQGYYDLTQIDQDWFPVGSTLEDIYRYHAERGDFGPGNVDDIVENLITDARSFEASKYTRPMPIIGKTLEIERIPLEKGGYVMIFLDITERVKAEEEKSVLEKELVQAQRLESLGTLASGIAHEINTPIQYVGDNIRFIAQSLRDMLEVLQLYRKSMRQPIDPGLIAEYAEAVSNLEQDLDLAFVLEELPLALEQSSQGVKQVATIVKAIKEFSHPGQDQMTEFDINAIIDTTLIVSKNQWKYFAEVETDLDRTLPHVKCLPGELGQALLNLVVNAAHAIEAAGRDSGVIHISTRRENTSIIVVIEDNGCGIPDTIKERIYDPFFTTKDIGQGTGQGLSITFNAIVNKHGGTIDCVSHEGEGTVFTLSIPMEQAETGDEEAAA